MTTISPLSSTQNLRQTNPTAPIARASVEGLNNPAVDKGLSLALACAEGNSNKDGSKRFLGVSDRVPNGYPADLHQDPGDLAWNKGRLSYAPTRHGKDPNMSVADCERNAIGLINNRMAELDSKLQGYGMSPANKNYRFVMACLMDSVNQTGTACFEGKNSLWNQMPNAIKRLNAGENPEKVMTEARIASHAKDDGSCGSFGGSWADTRADQARRVGEIYDCLKAHGGMSPMTGKGANAPAAPSASQPKPGASDSSFEPTPPRGTNIGGVPPSSALATSQLLGTGDKGQNVEDLQKQLNLAGASPRLAEDGDFGPNTEAAVRSFQQQYGLKVDGLAGPQTLSKLHEVLRPTAASPQPSTSGSGALGNLNAGTMATIGGAGYKPSFEIKPGSTGPKVTELKQALKDAGFYKGAVNDQMGPEGVAALKEAKAKLHLGGAQDVAGDFTLKKIQEYAAAQKAGGVPGTSARVDVGFISQFDSRVPGYGNTACDEACEYMMKNLAKVPTTPGQSNAEVRPFYGGTGQEPLNYLKQQLQSGRPVMMGVDYKPGDGYGSNINEIDHYLVATGYGVDDQGREFISFNDPQQTDPSLGKDTNPENRLYLNKSTGQWSQEGISKPYRLAGVVENH